jgi:hypothetical protein
MLLFLFFVSFFLGSLIFSSFFLKKARVSTETRMQRICEARSSWEYHVCPGSEEPPTEPSPSRFAAGLR